MSLISKIEPIPDTQDIYLDAPKGQLQPLGSTPAGMDAELDAVVAASDAAPGPAEGVSDEELRAKDRKPSTRDVEAALMLHEINCAKSRPYMWQNQERWAKKYEQERIGKIMHSREFIKRMAAAGVELRANEYGRMGRIGINAMACPSCKSGRLAECAQTCTGRGFDFVENGNGKPLADPVGNLLCMHCGGKQIKHHPATRRCRSKDGKRWLKKKFAVVLVVAVKGKRKFDWMTLAALHNGATPEYSVMRFDAYGVPTNEKYHGWRTALLDLMFAGVVSKRQAEKAFGKVERVSEATKFYLEQLKSVRW